MWYEAFFHIICVNELKKETVVPHQRTSNDGKPIAFYALPSISPYVPHYNMWPWRCASVVRALFIIAMRPCYYRSWRLSLRGETYAGGFYLPAFSMRTCACRWRAHVVNQWQREQSCESPCAKTEGERADAVVHPLTLALCRLTKRSRCAYTHMCCHTMTRSVDEATRTETRQEMKKKYISLFFFYRVFFLQYF